MHYFSGQPNQSIELESWWISNEIQKILDLSEDFFEVTVSPDSTITLANTDSGTEAFCFLDFLVDESKNIDQIKFTPEKNRKAVLAVLDYVFDLEPHSFALMNDLAIRSMPSEAREFLEKFGYNNSSFPNYKYPLPVNPNELEKLSSNFNRPSVVTVCLTNEVDYVPSTTQMNWYWTGYSETLERYEIYGFLNWYKRDSLLLTDPFLDRLERQFGELTKYRLIQGDWQVSTE